MRNTSPKILFNDLVRYIASQIPAIKTLQLVKIIYLVELEYKIKFGENLTEVPIIRLPMGPVSANYKSLLDKLVTVNAIQASPQGRGVCYSAQPFDYLSPFELEVLQPVIDFIKKIIHQNPAGATEIIKGMSYQTLPMRRFVQHEKITGEVYLGRKVLQLPYFTEQDIDQLAKERRALRDHLKQSPQFTEKDDQRGMKIAEDMMPYLTASNRLTPEL